jgi:parallel beta-helix repeat protein
MVHKLVITFPTLITKLNKIDLFWTLLNIKFMLIIKKTNSFQDLRTISFMVNRSFLQQSVYRLLLVISIVFLFTLPLSATDYFVSSSSGSDANPGTSISAPWRTLTKVNSFTPKPGDQILFKRGDTWTGTLTVKASGTSVAPITYGAWGEGAKPVITGFTTISGWTNEGGGIYSKVITSESQTNMVTINGKNYGMGRFPNEGEAYLIYESFNSNISITDNELPGTPNWTGAELIKRPNGWVWERCKITNHSGTTITYTNALSSYSGIKGNGYFIQNDLRTLDRLGEWYHNTGTGKFYMYFGSENPSFYTIRVATKNSLITNAGKQFVTIRDLDIQGSIQNAVYNSTLSNNFTIQNCNISFAGDYGIYINSQNGLVDGNTINDCNQGAIRGMSSLINITNNDIFRIGIIVGSSKLFYNAIMTTVNNEGVIAYNSIDSVGKNGIHIKGNNTLIQYNFVNNSCLILNDGGGIYIVGASGNTGMLIDHNIVLNTLGNKDSRDSPVSLGEGIFLDEYANGITVSNNTCAYNGYSGIKLHKAHSNSIEGNHCFDNIKTGIYLLNSSTTINNLYDIIIQNNQFVAKSGQQALMIREPNTSVTDPSGIGTLNNNVYARPVSDNQVFQTYYNKTWSYRTLSQWQSFSGKDANSRKSPQAITSDNDLQLEYNATKSSKQFPLVNP